MESSLPDAGTWRRRVDDVARAAGITLNNRLKLARLSVQSRQEHMEAALPNTVDWRRRVDDVAESADVLLDNRLNLARLSVQSREERLRALDPAAVLRRGFSVLQNQTTNQVVTSTRQVAGGDTLSITVTDGSVPAVAGRAAKAPRKRRQAVAGQAPLPRLL
jgi:exodeoxyribonuclease VII large subunit